MKVEYSKTPVSSRLWRPHRSASRSRISRERGPWLSATLRLVWRCKGPNAFIVRPYGHVSKLRSPFWGPYYKGGPCYLGQFKGEHNLENWPYPCHAMEATMAASERSAANVFGTSRRRTHENRCRRRCAVSWSAPRQLLHTLQRCIVIV